MVDFLGRKQTHRISARSECHRTAGQVLGENLKCSESLGPRLLQCEISSRPMSVMGQSRPRRSKPHHRACPLHPESGQISRHLGTSALCHKPRFDPDPNAQARNLSRYAGNPAAQRASLKEVFSAGGQPIPANCWLQRNAGCNSRTRAAAAFASSRRPSFASGAASTM